MNTEVQEALVFFGLGEGFSSEDLKKKYHELALKYHPDRGEYTSETMFIRLMEYKSILENYLETNYSIKQSEKEVKKESDFGIYKTAKKIENDSILQYFKSRKKALIMELSIEKNPELKVLLENLVKARDLYLTLLEKYPDSIWARDTKDSLEGLKVWLKYL
ncbi:MAG: DnaJ domain-containing protein [Leptospiraceae bacterium]|nr:DnaJ domain-containing protein [Leptospiraceae bacterium]